MTPNKRLQKDTKQEKKIIKHQEELHNDKQKVQNHHQEMLNKC